MKNYKLTSFCEFDKYATKAYCAIHNETEDKNLGDITKVDETKLEPFTMIVGGSPCQDFSVAGKQKGSVWTCKDCSNEKQRKEYEWKKDIINARKREKRKTLLAQQKMKLDEIFYSDENIKKIIKIEWIEKRRKKAFKWDIKKDKFFYFLNRGYDKDLLISLYGKHYL